MHLNIYLQGASMRYIERNDILKIQFDFVVVGAFDLLKCMFKLTILHSTHLRCEILTTGLFYKKNIKKR